MITGVWGQKIGMTQVFSDNKVIPVTVIEVAYWYVTNVKKEARDGYNAVQIGCLRDRYKKQTFVHDWLKKSQIYFRYVREVKCDADFVNNVQIGDRAEFLNEFPVGTLVDVVGWSKGLGFAGVYKRHGFGGAAKTHGSMMGRRPGSIGFTRSSGEIMRGQLMAGHKGCDRVVMKRLGVVAVEPQDNIILVKGSVPGKSKSLVFVKRA